MGRRSKIKQAEEEVRGQPPSYTVSHGVRVKVIYTEERRGKSPEANIVRII